MEQLLASASKKHEDKQYAAALADFDSAIAIDPNSSVAYLKRGQCKHDAMMLEAAIADYNHAISLSSTPSFFIYVLCGDAHKQLKNFEYAITNYETAAKLNPTSITSVFNVALCYNELGKIDDAIAAFDRLIALDTPNTSDFYLNRGLLKHNKHQFDEAIADFTVALEKNPANEVNIRNQMERTLNAKKQIGM